LPTCDPPKYIRVGAEQLGFDFVKQCPGEKERPSGTMPRWPFVGAWNTPRSVSHGPSSLCPQDVLRTPFLACAALPRLAVAAAAGPNSLVQTPCGSQRVPGPPALLLSLAQSPSRRHCCRRCQALTPTVSVLTYARGPSAGSYFLLALASPGARAPAPSLAVSQGSVPAQTSWASSGEVPLARWPAMVYHAPTRGFIENKLVGRPRLELGPGMYKIPALTVTLTARRASAITAGAGGHRGARGCTPRPCAC
jgi:hypothetical protein